MAAPPIRHMERTESRVQSGSKRCADDRGSPDFYSVILDRSVHGKELGVAVDVSQKSTLRIRAINDGMIKRFNEMNDGPRVRAGDEILKVNDVTGDAKKMAHACKTEHRLRLLMCKGVDLKTPVPEAKKPKVNGTRTPISRGKVLGLYDLLPASNPENDALAKKKAVDSEGVGRCTSFATNRCIFLDIDGVLRPLQGSTFNVSTITIDGISIPLAGCGSDFLASAMTALRFIIQETGAQLVLSSEWRRHPTLKDGVEEALQLAHLPALVGETTTEVLREMGTGDPLYSFAERRVKEIGAYLRDNPTINSWVAIDDIDLAVADSRKSPSKPQIGHNFVRTDDDVGLTIELAHKTVEILQRKPAKR
eukprot:GEMP01039180.1.p1 GENE.GEMP01039180.1~~GEMP01039180.1.p1  ORF type:complete len:364 (-),score=63.65 GEMP01039180.1:830-1921(-)